MSTALVAKVYYDGLCHLCSAEISAYKKIADQNVIQFIDITTADFDAQKEKLDPYLIHQELHAKDLDGQLHIGVDAFILIWSKIEKLKFLSRLAQVKTIKGVLQLGYKLFVKVRPYLPRKKCEDSPYCKM